MRQRSLSRPEQSRPISPRPQLSIRPISPRPLPQPRTKVSRPLPQPNMTQLQKTEIIQPTNQCQINLTPDYKPNTIPKIPNYSPNSVTEPVELREQKKSLQRRPVSHNFGTDFLSELNQKLKQ